MGKGHFPAVLMERAKLNVTAAHATHNVNAVIWTQVARAAQGVHTLYTLLNRVTAGDFSQTTVKCSATIFIRPTQTQ